MISPSLLLRLLGCPSCVQRSEILGPLDEAFLERHAFQPHPLGRDDGGVAEIAADGSRVIWATYLGGSDYDAIVAKLSPPTP